MKDVKVILGLICLIIILFLLTTSVLVVSEVLGTGWAVAYAISSVFLILLDDRW